MPVDEEALFSGEDVLLSRSALPGNASETQNGITVVLDTNVTPKLAAEGLARELLSRIQNLRKDAGLSVSQRITLYVDASGVVAEMLDHNDLRELIQRETLATELNRTTTGAFPPESRSVRETIDGETLTLALRPA